MSKYDIIIIGSGPAGISAAITASIRNKKILLLGQKDLSQKITKAHTINNYPGLPEISGEQLAAALQNHLDRLGIEVTAKRANMIYDMGDYFAVQSGQDMLEADTVILATGMITQKVFPGENELLGKGVSYCATCDAALYRGKTAAVIAYSKDEETEAEFLCEYADKVYYLPMYKDEPQIKEDFISSGKFEIIHNSPQSIDDEGSGTVKFLVTDDGTIETDGVFILRESIAPDYLIPGLEMDGNHVKTDRSQATNIAGLFACGDITGQPYQYIKSAGEGNVAALSAVSYIDSKKRAAAGSE